MDKMYVSPEKVIVPQVVEFPRFYATKMFITKFRSSELSLSKCYRWHTEMIQGNMQ